MSISAISAASRSSRPGSIIVFPCLLLNYFGQGAFVLAHGGAPQNPFFEMLPEWALLPMVGLATAATVIASQAVISGRLFADAPGGAAQPAAALRRSSTRRRRSPGQIYMPRVNMLLAIGVMLLVVGFGESSALASAYGISVTGEMLVTTILLFVVMRHRWKWQLGAAHRADRRFSPSSIPASSSPMRPRCSTAAGCRSASPA